MNSHYTTKTTYLGPEYGYGCRIFYDNILMVESRCESRFLIGPTYRDLFRDLDKCGPADEFTSAARHRKYKEGNYCVSAKHVFR